MKGDFARKVADEVEKLKAHDALKLEYMSLFARMTDERDEGIEQGTINSIRNVMKNLNLSLEKAMDVTGVPKAEQSTYREKILSLG